MQISSRPLKALLLALLVYPAAASCAQSTPKAATKALKSPKQAVKDCLTGKKGKFDLKNVECIYGQAGSMEAQFVQTVYQASLMRTKSSKGRILLSKPNKVRWEIYEPEKSIMVTNGYRVWYYTPDVGENEQGQVVIRPFTKQMARNALVGILNGTVGVDREFKRLGQTKEKDGYRIRLEPREKLQDIREVELLVSDEYRIRELKLSHLSGNTTTIRLQNVQLGAKKQSNLFKFMPPPGTEVVKSP